MKARVRLREEKHRRGGGEGEWETCHLLELLCICKVNQLFNVIMLKPARGNNNKKGDFGQTDIHT